MNRRSLFKTLLAAPIAAAVPPEPLFNFVNGNWVSTNTGTVITLKGAVVQQYFPKIIPEGWESYRKRDTFLDSTADLNFAPCSSSPPSSTV